MTATYNFCPRCRGAGKYERLNVTLMLTYASHMLRWVSVDCVPCCGTGRELIEEG